MILKKYYLELKWKHCPEIIAHHINLFLLPIRKIAAPLFFCTEVFPQHLAWLHISHIFLYVAEVKPLHTEADVLYHFFIGFYLKGHHTILHNTLRVHFKRSLIFLSVTQWYELSLKLSLVVWIWWMVVMALSLIL